MPKITLSPLVSSGKIVDLLFTAGVTVISLVTVIYSLLFVVVQWVSGAFSMRLALFRDDPIVWRAFAYAIGLFVFCFTAAFAIGTDQKVSVVVPVLALVLVVGALAFMRVLQTRAFVSMLLAPTLTAISERGREVLDGLYPPGDAAPSQPLELRSPKRTVTWAARPTVLQQLHLVPLVAAASAAGRLSCSGRPSAPPCCPACRSPTCTAVTPARMSCCGRSFPGLSAASTKIRCWRSGCWPTSPSGAVAGG